jgi:hypothetical protein
MVKGMQTICAGCMPRHGVWWLCLQAADVNVGHPVLTAFRPFN